MKILRFYWLSIGTIFPFLLLFSQPINAQNISVNGLTKSELIADIIYCTQNAKLINSEIVGMDPTERLLELWGQPDYSKIFPFYTVRYYRKFGYDFEFTSAPKEAYENEPIYQMKLTAQPFFAQKIFENDLGAFNSSFGNPWTELRPDEHLVEYKFAFSGHTAFIVLIFVPDNANSFFLKSYELLPFSRKDS